MHKSYEIVAFTMICSTFLGLRDKTTNLLDVFFNTVCRRDCTYFFFGKSVRTCFGTRCAGRCWCAMTGDDRNKHAKVKNQLPPIFSIVARFEGSEFRTLPGRNIGLSIHAMGAWRHWSLVLSMTCNQWIKDQMHRTCDQQFVHPHVQKPNAEVANHLKADQPIKKKLQRLRSSQQIVECKVSDIQSLAHGNVGNPWNPIV